VSTRTITAIAALAASLICAAGAEASVVSYTGQGTNLQPGQSKGHPVLVGFELRGPGCPGGPRCLDHATVSTFDGVSWAYPNCPEVLDGLFDLDKSVGHRLSSKGHSFRAAGASEDYAGDHVTIAGRLLRRGRVAKGWFKVTDAGCSTGRINWTARPD
jgi:hypothetical protein